ncbi:putative FBD domain, leucine-rich repeat domain superfamily, F-box-like domain superfamily [Arabidopsis thaliana]
MECDRISALPDHLVANIVSYLGIKDSIKTSVLSKRWEFVWLKVVGLDLKNCNFPPNGIASQMVVNKYMEFNRGFLEWIATAVDRGVQHLDVGSTNLIFIKEFMPKNIYKSKTLVSLKLTNVGIMKHQELVVSLPCLKIMHLNNVYYDDGPSKITEKLLLGCPVLEEFTMVRVPNFDNEESHSVLRVRSQTLKIFCLTFYWGMYSTVFSVEIDAPRLKYMSFRDDLSAGIVVKNLSSLVKIDLDTDFNVNVDTSPLEPVDLSKRDIIRDFLTGISGVRHMIISNDTLEVLYHYSKMVLQIPTFHNLSHLEASFFSTSLQLLTAFLESCPNLKSLILTVYYVREPVPGQIDLTSVPRCLTSTLEYVKIKNLNIREETGINLANYFLENSAVLKKLTLSFKDCPIPDKASDIIMELLTSTKLSHICQVIVD